MDQAEATFRQAIQMRPKDYANYSALGAFYYKTGKYSAAAAQFREVTRLTPDNSWAYDREFLYWRNLAKASNVLGDSSELARNAFYRVIELGEALGACRE